VPVIEWISRGVLDTPLEPVIGLAEGETRWWGMTPMGVLASALANTARAASYSLQHRENEG
jgi:hypothetical protein